MSNLTPQQEKFAQEVAKGKSQADAYRAAYPKSKTWKDDSVHNRASAMMRHTQVVARVRNIQAKAADKAMMTAADVLKEAMKLARFDVRLLLNPDGTPKQLSDLDDETAAAIQGIELMQIGGDDSPVMVKRYKVADKNAALEKLFKHFGLYEQDNKQKTDPLHEFIESLSGRVIGASK